MGKFILYLENEVPFSSLSPTAGQIEGALQAIPLVQARATRQGMGLLDNGGFVGSARITRRTGTFNRITDVAWLYQWPDRATQEAEAAAYTEISGYVRAQADLALNANAWKPAQIIPYDPAANGSVVWWTDGTASQTVTRNTFDLNEQTGSNQNVDNPLGPTTSHAPDLDPLGTHDPDSAFNKILGAITTIAIVGATGAVLYYVVGPIVQAVTSKGSAAR